MKKINDDNLVEIIDSIAYNLRKIMMDDNIDNDDLFKAIQDSGIKLYGMTNDEYDGFLLWNGHEKQPEIYLDVNQPVDRRRFTLAHELGHLVLEYKWTPSSGIKKENEPKEEVLSISFREKDKECDTEDINERVINEFAGAFLMPKEEVKKVIKSDMNDLDKIVEVSNKFKVTLRAAKNRLIVIGEINER